MPGTGPSVNHPAATSPEVSPEIAAAASLYRQARAEGRREADAEIAAALLGQNTGYRARMDADQELAAYGAGGRAHFGDPRPGDFPGRARRPATQYELEAEAG